MEQIQTFDVLILGGPKSGKKRFAERERKHLKTMINMLEILKKINTMVLANFLIKSEFMRVVIKMVENTDKAK